MTIKTRSWSPQDFLKEEDHIVAYLEAALEDGDPALIAAAFGDVARAQGMTRIAKAIGLQRESLYKSLSKEGNPSFFTILKLTDELGLSLRLTKKTKISEVSGMR